MLPRRFSATQRCTLSLRLAMLGICCLFCLASCTQPTIGQIAQVTAPSQQPSGLPNSDPPPTATEQADIEQTSVEPLTRQASESSTEITPENQRIMSDIQEIRAMLGGGLKAEFEEIDKTLRQYRSSAGRSSANERSDQPATAAGDWFSRELGEMVRRRSQLLPAAEQENSGSMKQPERSKRPVAGQSNKRSALRQCARELEAVAASLEQIEAYENADSVRQEAAGLWEKARQ
jgi:hypothetical protein